ncbi:uncharacterized protein LOC133202723 [Saccostrea echinata]|uniref:uncharacterized protein LOC133202723 n=1 Tax=Saccostrea echinata TaxID=191078 RepID=UPI002A83083E|nr:uncharacterized protein LOC133202723 [Saccostrea echinata]
MMPSSSVSDSEERNASKFKRRKSDLISSDEPLYAFKENTSRWQQADLEALGIIYDQNDIPLYKLIDRVKQVAWRGHVYKSTLSPEHLSVFANLMKEFLTLCLPFENGPRPVTFVEAVSLIAEIEETREKFYNHTLQAKALLDSLTKETKREYLLWQARTYDFLKYLGIFQESRSSCPLRKSQYTNLFMKFTEIFSLQPELGGNREASIAIGQQKTVSSPDVRFVSYPRFAPATVLIAHSEVSYFSHKKEKTESAADFDIHELSPSILGQHGGELLAERHSSFFTPGVLGMICLKSTIIFTFLEISEDHYRCVKKGLDCREKVASICYTKPYDYWDPKDRDEIYSTLFWLGHLQSSEK